MMISLQKFVRSSVRSIVVGAGVLILLAGLVTVALLPGGMAEAANDLRQLAGAQAGALSFGTGPGTESAGPAEAASQMAYTPYQVADPNAYVYPVRMGESWSAIANRFGLTYSGLVEANQELWQLRGAIVHPDDEMAIPGLGAGQMVETITYEVQRGDSWRKIADTHGIFFWDLKLDNYSLWQHRGAHIQPGDMLTIRNSALAEAAAPAEVRSSAEAEEAAEPEAVEEVDPVSIEGPLAPAVSQPLLVETPPSTGSVYTVRPGDSWYGIAAANNMTFQKLRGANPDAWRLRGANLRVGDQLIIPAQDETVDPPGIRQDEAEATPAPAEEPVEESAEESAEEPTAEPTEEPVEEPADESAAGEPALRFYIVIEGDTWLSIAETEGITVEALQAANVELNGRDLVPGDEVRLP